MAEVKFTEKELGFINECTIDKRGHITQMPANPFPSLYRKGVIKKAKDGHIVAKEFRDMFYLDSQVIDIDLTKPEGEEVEAEADKVKPEDVGDIIPDKEIPGEYWEFRKFAASGLKDKRTKGTDELQFIAKAEEVYSMAREARAANGSEGMREERTVVGRRKKWRRPLAEVVADYFGVDYRYHHKSHEIIFYGDLYMCGACELVFEYLFKIGNRRAQRAYDDALAAGEPTIGRYNDKAEEFLEACRERLKPFLKDIVVDGKVVGELTDEYLDEA